MAHIAAELRPTVIGAVALLVLAVAPWEHRVPPCTAPMVTAEAVNLTIELPDAVAIPNAALGALAHPDARPWPDGMVIAPPASADHNVLGRQNSVVDRMVTAVIQALRPFTT